MNQIVTMNNHVANKIIRIQNQNVILDTDVAELYCVETREINQAVKNNPNKFPSGYVLDLTESEWIPLRSKFLISNKGGRTYIPKAFTEKGLYMLATIIKSPQAVATTLAIIETFASNGTIVETEGVVKAFDPNYGNIILMTEKEKILVKQFFRIRRIRNDPLPKL